MEQLIGHPPQARRKSNERKRLIAKSEFDEDWFDIVANAADVWFGANYYADLERARTCSAVGASKKGISDWIQLKAALQELMPRVR